jgi:hypothetical protein
MTRTTPRLVPTSSRLPSAVKQTARPAVVRGGEIEGGFDLPGAEVPALDDGRPPVFVPDQGCHAAVDRSGEVEHLASRDFRVKRLAPVVASREHR